MERLIILPHISKKERTVLSDSTRIIGGAKIGASYSEFFIKAESIHQNVGFSGYPIGNVSMEVAVFGSIEDICKSLIGQRKVYDYEIKL